MEFNIRKWEMSDSQKLAGIMANPNIVDNMRDGLLHPYTEDEKSYFIWNMMSADDDKTFAYTIETEGKVVGNIGVFRQESIHNRTAELGYYLAEEYWGRGIMTASVKWICDYVFKNSNIIRIYAEPFAENRASCRVLEKAGFELEGILKCNAEKNGVLVDMKMYALIKKQ